jgi:hypothetical protein
VSRPTCILNSKKKKKSEVVVDFALAVAVRLVVMWNHLSLT